MAKLTKHDRLQVTHAIEDTLEAYCRVCPYIDSRNVETMCSTCPVGVILKSYGMRLTNEEVAPEKPAKWTPEEDAKLMDLVSKAKFGGMEDVAIAMGRTLYSCYMRKSKLAKKGLI